MSNKTPALISLFLGGALLAGSAYMYFDTQKLVDNSIRVSGTVVDFERRLSKGGSSYYPVIEFITTSGEIHHFTTTGATDFAKNEKVEVLYDAADPANAKVNAFLELWLGTFALGVFGLLCVGVGMGSLLYARSR